MRSNPRKTPRRGRRQARNLSLLVLFVIALAVLIIISPSEPTKSALNVNAQGQVVSVYEGLVISEAMSANASAYPDEGGNFVDWLELAVASHAGAVHAEVKVVEAFLYLMSRRDTYESLAKSEGLLGALHSTVVRLRDVLSGGGAATPASADLGLVEVIAAGLDGMTTSVWPDRVFELGGTLGEVGDAKESANVA